MAEIISHVPYMEEEVSLLEESELLRKIDGDKYITSFFIAPKECREEINALCEDFAYENYKKLWQVASDFVAGHRRSWLTMGLISQASFSISM